MINLDHQINWDDNYCPAIKEMIFNGQMDVAKMLLLIQPAFETTPFQVIKRQASRGYDRLPARLE